MSVDCCAESFRFGAGCCRAEPLLTPAVVITVVGAGMWLPSAAKLAYSPSSALRDRVAFWGGCARYGAIATGLIFFVRMAKAARDLPRRERQTEFRRFPVYERPVFPPAQRQQTGGRQFPDLQASTEEADAILRRLEAQRKELNSPTVTPIATWDSVENSFQATNKLMKFRMLYANLLCAAMELQQAGAMEETELEQLKAVATRLYEDDPQLEKSERHALWAALTKQYQATDPAAAREEFEEAMTAYTLAQTEPGTNLGPHQQRLLAAIRAYGWTQTS